MEQLLFVVTSKTDVKLRAEEQVDRGQETTKHPSAWCLLAVQFWVNRYQIAGNTIVPPPPPRGFFVSCFGHGRDPWDGGCGLFCSLEENWEEKDEKK